MKLYSKYGSYPKTDTDGTEGWTEVSLPPNPIPEGKELVWIYPPGWVIRDPMPVKEGSIFKWNQNDGTWYEYIYLAITDSVEVESLPIVNGN
jgi:hypothetical protein